ncbi:MAG TPA: fibronectin type III domain-containing protein, partial [Verrucomicrobiae bacterium]
MAALTLALFSGRPLQAGQSVTLAWDPNPENDIAGYILYYGVASGNYTSVTNVGNRTTNTVSGLTSAVTYYFAVTAYNTSSLESDPSTEISYTVPPAQANNLPVISAIPGQSTGKNTPTPAIPFTISDVETPAANLQLSAVSSNPWLVPNASILLSGIGSNRTITIQPATNLTGTASITVAVSDGAATTTSTFTLDVTGNALDTWRLLHFSPSDLVDASKEAMVWGDKADPDHDGLDNLLEFALGFDPGQREASALGVVPGLVEIAGQKYLEISYKHRINEPLLQYLPEVS